MHALLLILALVPRPEYEPVGRLEIERVAELERRCEQAAPEDRAMAVTEREVVPGRLVVGFEPGCEQQARELVAAQGGRVKLVGSGFLVTDWHGPGAPAGFQTGPGIRFVEPDYVVRACHIPNDPYFLQHQWDKWVMYADRAWDMAMGGPGVKVGIVDNGVEYQHPDLAGNFVPGQYGYDFVSNDADPSPDDIGVLEAFHGTHVAGIVAASIDNSTGVAGWARVQLVAVRVLNDSGKGSTSELAAGIRWAVDNGCQVINMSLGGFGLDTPVLEACQYAAQQDVLLVGAAGNDGTGQVYYPAALSECVCVGATDENSGLAAFSNHGAQQELVAPGTSIVSTATGGNYLLADGTSMAAPQVSGVAALVLVADNTLSAKRLRAIIDAAAVDKGATGRDPVYGFGLLNAGRALELALLVRGEDVKPRGPDTVVLLGRGEFELPGWAEQAWVYDGAGRLVRAEKRVQGFKGSGVMMERSGTYFVRLEGKEREGLVRLLVVN